MDTLKIGAVSRNYFNMPLWICDQVGFLAEQGIRPEIHLIESIDAVSDSIASGELDLGLSVTENVILERERGGDLKIIGGNVNRLPFSFVAVPEVRSYGDLLGKRIGVSSLDAGSSSLVMELLAEHGLHYPDDYTLIACGPILTRWKMLQSGDIDAGLQGVPLNYVAIDAGFNDLGNPRDRFPDFQFTSLNVSAHWADTHHDLLVRFMTAFLEAHEWFYSNREASVPIACREAGVGEDYARRAWDDYVRDQIFPRDGRCSRAAVQTLIDVSALIRARSSRARAEEYIDHSYLEEAERRRAGDDGQRQAGA